jgi:hypothetical protein
MGNIGQIVQNLFFSDVNSRGASLSMLMWSSFFKGVVWSLGLVWLVSCASSSANYSETKITNGKVTSAYPAVVKLDVKNGEKETFCTGTFLSDAVVLTAAHCFFTVDSDEVKTGAVKAISYVRHAKFQYHIPALPDLDGTVFDVALVKFPQGTSKDFLSLTQKPENAGSKLILVGFGGSNAHHGAENSSKREGLTVVTDRRDGRYFIEGGDGVIRQDKSRQVFPNEVYASISNGDSGGPLLTSDGRSILGIASWGSFSTDRVGVAEGVYNDVLGQESQAFLRENLKKYGM